MGNFEREYPMANEDKPVRLEDIDPDRRPKVVEARSFVQRTGPLQQEKDSIDFAIEGCHPSEGRVVDDKVLTPFLTTIGLVAL